MGNRVLQRAVFILALICLSVLILSFGKGLLSPIVWGLMIALSSVHLLERVHVKLSLSWFVLSLFYVLFILFVISGVFYFLIYEVQLIVFAIPELDSRLIELEENFVGWLSGMGINIQNQLNFNYITNKIAENSDSLISLAGGFGKQLGNLFLVLLYSFFFLYYKHIYNRFIELRYKDPKRVGDAKALTERIIRIVSNYLSGTLLMTLGLAIILYLMFLIMGIEYALFFSLFVAILNLIPYIGNPIGMLVVVFYAFLTKDGILVPILVLIGINVANQIQENVLRPLIIGDKLKLNAFAVFISVVAGGFLWGVSGMILLIPVTGIIKLVLEQRESTKPYALFFGDVDKPKKERHWFRRKKHHETKVDTDS
jgi:predicted PurR-regulated permease PerM